MNQNNNKAFAKCIVIYLLVMAAMVLWHFWFVGYVEHSGFIKDVFRLNFEENLMPFYGRLSKPIPNHLFLVVLIIPVWLIFLRQKKYSGRVVILFYFFCCVIFSLSDNPIRFSNLIAHYEAYALDLHRFNSMAELFRNYNSLQATMDIHNQHYPPGNLIALFIFNKAGFISSTWIFYLLIFCVVIYLSTKTTIHHAKQLVLFTTPGLLIFPSLDNVLIPAVCMYLIYVLYMKYTSSYNKLIPVWIGLVAFVFSMFSFVLFVAGIFFFILISLQLYYNKVKMNAILRLLVISAFAFLILHVGNYAATGFNWYECLQNSIELNKKVMQTNGFDNFARYLLRSTGNLFGLIISMGFVVGLFFYRKNIQLQNSSYYAFVATSVIASFSGLFFMETERVFVFLIPAGIYALSPLLNQLDTRGLQRMAMLNLIFAVTQEIFLKHFL